MGVETERYFARKNRWHSCCLGTLGIFIVVCVLIAIGSEIFQ